jgi:FkbM family methyltransferase
MRWLPRRRTQQSAPEIPATVSDVHHAYRLLLGRDPDPAGLSHYTRRVRDGFPLAELIREFVRSDEYHDRWERERLDDDRPVDLGGYRVLVPTSDPDFGAIIHSYRQYEEPVRAAMRAGLAPGDVCVDVGANIGVMTFLAASIVGSEGRVIALEPNPGNVQLLYRGLLLNGFANVQVLPLAASDRRAVFSLSGRSNTHLVEPRGPSGGGSFAQSVTLDEVAADLPRVDFVKMDIEGHEPQALRGSVRLIARHHPTLLVEFNPRCLKTQDEDPLAYVTWLFARYSRVRAISHFGDDRTFERAGDLITFWQKRAAQVTAAGQLPEGMLHFDLVAERVSALIRPASANVPG